MKSLVNKIIEVHQSLEDNSFPHAFGGALALAWCTSQARGTIDIDINIFVPVEQSEQVSKALPDGVECPEDKLAILKRDGQVRLWFETSPLDVFLNTTDYHDQLWQRIHFAPLASTDLPFLSCLDLAVFKAFYNRTKDWADLEAMVEAGALNIDEVRKITGHYLGDDDRLEKLEALRQFQKF